VEATAPRVLRHAVDGRALLVGDPSGGQWQTRQPARLGQPQRRLLTLGVGPRQVVVARADHDPTCGLQQR